jgi:hypothetical protein
MEQGKSGAPMRELCLVQTVHAKAEHAQIAEHSDGKSK